MQPPIAQAQSTPGTVTQIQHLVVIFQENISFDHYFATYPNATNPQGEPKFTPAAGTPSVNGLSAALLTDNPNALNSANGTGATNPFRLDRSQAATADQNRHNYAPEISWRCTAVSWISILPRLVSPVPPNPPELFPVRSSELQASTWATTTATP